MAAYRPARQQPKLPNPQQGQVKNEATSCLHFDYDTVCEATKGFDKRSVSKGGCKLGEGGFGPVFKGELNFTEVAIKVLRRAQPGNKGASELANEQFEAEIQVLSKFRHPNLVTLIGYTNEPSLPRCLIYEFMPNGTLEDLLEVGAESRKTDKVAGLPWMARLSIALDTARGLSFLHTAIKNTPLVHRDVKSANVLLDYSFRAKVGDFGLVRAIGHDPNAQIKQSFTARIVGTSGYIAPEYFRGKITTKLDTYAFGVLLLEILTGLPSYNSQRGQEHAELVSYIEHLKQVPSFTIIQILDKNAGAWPLESFKELFAIAERCLDPNFSTRPEMSEVYVQLNKLTAKSSLYFADQVAKRSTPNSTTQDHIMTSGSSGGGTSMYRESRNTYPANNPGNNPANKGLLVVPGSAPIHQHRAVSSRENPLQNATSRN